MLYKTTRIASEFSGLHPDLKSVLLSLDAWLFEGGMERPTITDAIRTADEQEKIYLPVYLKKKLEPSAAKRMARARFSWHRCGCAADFRHTAKPYSPEERAKIWEWLKARCPGSEWELVEHNVGLGLHFHIAKRDFLVRRQWEREQQGKGAV